MTAAAAVPAVAAPGAETARLILLLVQKHAAVAPALKTASPPEVGPTVAPVMAVAVPAVAAPGVETARLMLLLVHKHIMRLLCKNLRVRLRLGKQRPL